MLKNACKIGNAKFQAIVGDHWIRTPLINVGGKLQKSGWNDAIEKAANILADLKRHLLFVGGENSCETMEVGLHLGEYLGAVVDSISSVCHGPTAMGMQEAGRIGATAVRANFHRKQ